MTRQSINAIRLAAFSALAWFGLIAAVPAAAQLPDCPTDPDMVCTPYDDGSADATLCTLDGRTMQCSQDSGSRVDVICHCDPDGHASSDHLLAEGVDSRQIAETCGQCDNAYCRKVTGRDHIKSYRCDTRPSD